VVVMVAEDPVVLAELVAVALQHGPRL